MKMIKINDIEEFVIKFPNNAVIDKEKMQDMLSEKVGTIMQNNAKVTILDNHDHTKVIKIDPLTNLILDLFPKSQVIYYLSKEGRW
jgi:hypothetical protein